MDKAPKKVKAKTNPWEINQTDLDLARGIKPQAKTKHSSRTRSEGGSASRSSGRSGGRTGGRSNGRGKR